MLQEGAAYITPLRGRTWVVAVAFTAKKSRMLSYQDKSKTRWESFRSFQQIFDLIFLIGIEYKDIIQIYITLWFALYTSFSFSFTVVWSHWTVMAAQEERRFISRTLHVNQPRPHSFSLFLQKCKISWQWSIKIHHSASHICILFIPLISTDPVPDVSVVNLH